MFVKNSNNKDESNVSKTLLRRKMKRDIFHYLSKLWFVCLIILLLYPFYLFAKYKNSLINRMHNLNAAFVSFFDYKGFLNQFFGHGVNEVKVLGNTRIPTDKILEIIDHENEQSGLLFLNEIKHKIEEMPLVKSVTVRRDAWTRIIVDIQERYFIGYYNDFTTDETMYIDNDGEIGIVDNMNMMLNVPEILNVYDGKDFFDFHEILREYGIADEVYQATQISHRRWDVIFKNGLLIKFPSKDLQKALPILMEMNNKMNIFSYQNNIKYIDMRVIGRIYFRD